MHHAGCPPRKTCGVNVSPELSELLNANLKICSVFQTCVASFCWFVFAVRIYTFTHSPDGCIVRVMSR